ncbi:hypothetical protein AOLI_G00165460 [Acnodon oligacanthus]
MSVVAQLPHREAMRERIHGDRHVAGSVPAVKERGQRSVHKRTPPESKSNCARKEDQQKPKGRKRGDD